MSKGLCSTCKTILTSENSSFCVVKSGYGYCRECNRLCARKYRIENLEKIRRGGYKYRSENPDRVRGYSNKYRKSHPEKIRESKRDYNRKKKYGVLPEEFKNLLEKQNNRCAVCRNKFIKTPNVDHSHNSGKTRGLLCRCCNTVLGNAHDSILILGQAIRYLKKCGD